MAVAAFLIVELPALRHLTRFRHGMTFEFGHSLKGHDVPLSLNLTRGVFHHLSQSLWPNLGLPLLALGLIGLAAPLIAPSERRMPLMLIANFAVFHEASPLKPFPDFARYMLPLAPLLAILASWRPFRRFGSRCGERRRRRPARDNPPSSPPRARGWPPIATPTTIRPGSFSATVCGRRSRRPISW
jgi:hypothetical protein